MPLLGLKRPCWFQILPSSVFQSELPWDFLCRIGEHKPFVIPGCVLMLSPECTCMGCRHTRDIRTRVKSRPKLRRKRDIFIMEREDPKRNCVLLTFCCLQIKARWLSGKTDFGRWCAVGLCPGQAFCPDGPFRL